MRRSFSNSIPKRSQDFQNTALLQDSTDLTITASDSMPSGSKMWDAAPKGLTTKLIVSIISCAFGSSFQFGFSIGVVNAPASIIKDWLNDSNVRRYDEPLGKDQILLRWSVIVSIFCIGGMIGGMLSGVMAERFGRKGGLLINNILAIFSAILMGMAKMSGFWELLLVGRLLIGVNAGINTGIAPLYLTEISPVHVRGAIGTIHQLVITISILISQILGLSGVLGNSHWDLLFGFAIVPAVFQILTLPFCPESPRYLFLYKEHDERAQRALMLLRDSADVSEELDEMRAEREAMQKEKKVSLKEMFTNRLLRWPLFISFMVMLMQQLSGINAVMYYSTSTFEKAGMDAAGAQGATLAMGTINVLMTFVSMVLVDKAGRRTLLLTGEIGMIVFTILLTIMLNNVQNGTVFAVSATVSVILFVVMFATGPGSIPWFYVTELFTQGPRGTATAVAVVTNWAANWVVAVMFENLQEMIGPYVFLIFTTLLVFFSIFTWKYLPETKGKTIEEIQAEMKQNM